MTSLTESESIQLQRCERDISCGLANVGNAIRLIHDEKLWRGEYFSFEEYCEKRWGWKKSQAYNMISAGDVIRNISNNSTIVEKPTKESQCRPLASLPPQKQAEAWQDAVESAEGDQPTAAEVEQAAKPYKASQGVNQFASTAHIETAEDEQESAQRRPIPDDPRITTVIVNPDPEDYEEMAHNETSPVNQSAESDKFREKLESDQWLAVLELINNADKTKMLDLLESDFKQGLIVIAKRKSK